MKIKYCLLTLVCLYVLGNQLLAQDYALDFGGSGGNRYVYCQNLFVSGSQPRTVEAWVYPRTFTTNAGIFECGHGASGSGLINFGIRIGNANEWKVELHDETLVYNSTGTLNTWNHFALVYDGANVKLYHNGNLVINIAKSLNTYTSSFLIGRLAGGYFDGKIDEVRFWNVARSQAQIQSAMYTELAGNENGLLAEYRMNEGTGTTTLNSSTRSDLNANYTDYLNAQIRDNAIWMGGRTTTEVMPLIPTNITRYSATLRADVKNITANTTEIGICYGTTAFPLTSGSKITGSLTTGIFSGNITGLTSGTTYYFRPYVIQNSQVYYSTQSSFIAVPTAPSGSGNSWDDPIRISDFGHLAWVSENSSTWGKIFSQDADIDASATSSWPNGGWQPIGYYPSFTGKYYGNGHTVSGIYINRPTNDDQGLFGEVTGEIHSLAVINVNIRGNLKVGALAGSLYNNNDAGRTYTNCYSTGVVKGWSDAGGLIGSASGTFYYIRTCYSTCTVEALATYGSAGGLIASVEGNANAEITNCYSRGNVSGVHVGGFVNSANNLTISNCYSTGIVTATQDKGGFINIKHATLNNCYWDTETSGTTNSAGGTGLSTAQMKSYSSFKSLWDFYGESVVGTGDYWRIDESGTFNNGYPSLNWQGGPHQVKPTVTTQAVDNISPISVTGNGNITHLGSPSVVTQHGVCWSTSVNPTVDLPTHTSNGERTTTGAFTSTITGLIAGTSYHVRAYAINSIGITYGNDVVFTAYQIPILTTQAVTEITTTTATGNGCITNLGIPNPTQHGVCWSITANPTADLPTRTNMGERTTTGAFTSSITGLLPGSTYHVRAYATNSTGTVYGEDVHFTTNGVPSALNFNGINQYISGSLITTARDNITMEAWVKWDGQNGNRCIIYNGSSSDGYGLFLRSDASPAYSITILLQGVAYVQSTTALPTNSWHHIAAVRQSGTWKLYFDGIEKSVTNNTATPYLPSASFTIGAKAGQEFFKGSIDEVRFWTVARTETEILSAMCKTLSGTETGLAAYYNMNTGTGTNLSDISSNSKTGILMNGVTWCNDFSCPAGSGISAEDAYQICNLAHLYWIRQNRNEWSKYFKQMNDIDASSTSYWSDGGWTPIGEEGYALFSGKYDGQGFKIDGVYINRPSDNCQGFFRGLNGAVISRLWLTNCNIAGKNYTGALCGEAGNNSSVSSCHVSGTLSGAENIGLLIGWTGCSTITDCSASGNLTGLNVLGGLIGYDNSSTITSCFSAGNITCPQIVGGLLGIGNASNLSNSYSKANVTCTGSTNIESGGLIGWCWDPNNVINCYSIGVVSGNAQYKDGLIGRNSNAVINCFWDKTLNPTLGTSTPAANYGTGKTTAEMKTLSTYISAGWDFYGVNGGTIWNIGNVRNNGYPYLQWEYPDDLPLPVELSSFTAAAKNNKITLNWKTETEINNYGFEVERARPDKSGALDIRHQSLDSIPSGAEGWEKIGFVQGNGNSNSPKGYSFVDGNPPSGNLKYRLKQIDTDGRFEYYNTIAEVNLRPPGVEEKEVPKEFALLQNYPNPFNPVTIISWQLPVSSYVVLKVFDILGNEVTTLVNENKNPGEYKIKFDGSNLSSGIYYYQLRCADYVDTKKFILVK